MSLSLLPSFFSLTDVCLWMSLVHLWCEHEVLCDPFWWIFISYSIIYEWYNILLLKTLRVVKLQWGIFQRRWHSFFEQFHLQNLVSKDSLGSRNKSAALATQDHGWVGFLSGVPHCVFSIILPYISQQYTKEIIYMCLRIIILLKVNSPQFSIVSVKLSGLSLMV